MKEAGAREEGTRINGILEWVTASGQAHSLMATYLK